MINISTEIPQVAKSYELNAEAYQSAVERMLRFWAEMNTRFFDDVFPVEDMPIVIFQPLESVIGTFVQAHHSDFEYPTMTLCERILNGTDVLFKSGAEYEEGRIRYLEDAFLHEMIHHFAHDFSWQVGGVWFDLNTKDNERRNELAARGGGITVLKVGQHGFIFCHKANQIAEALGLPRVRVASLEEFLELEEWGELAEGEALLCDYFPHCGRPKEYYLGCMKRTT